MSCRLCKGNKKKLYATSTYGNFYIGPSGKTKMIFFDIDRCPKYGSCSGKDMRISVGLKIDYCPKCGAKLVTKHE